MKVEIAESVIMSWLRHAQGCVVTQMNWKPSPTWAVAREPELNQAFDAVRSFASEGIGVQIFKQGEFRQFLRQTEIDVLGLRLADSTSAPAVIAVETAFHDNGLQYGSDDVTIGRVLKKLIRAAFALEAYADAGEAEVIFATPKMAEPIRQGVQQYLAQLEPLLSRQANLAFYRMSIRIIANEDFASEIVEPVLSQVDAVADGSELFLRAQQLMRLCDPVRKRRSVRAKIAHPLSAAAGNGSRIGEHVRATMKQLAESGRLTADVVGQLLNARYCKARFNLRLPFLKAVDTAMDLSRRRLDERGYGRYWKQPLQIGSHDFLMCSQWYVEQRDAFDRWARDLG